MTGMVQIQANDDWRTDMERTVCPSDIRGGLRGRCIIRGKMLIADQPGGLGIHEGSEGTHVTGFQASG